VRAFPDYDAPRTGLVLMQHEIFAISQQFPGADGRIYLYLSDGQGWVFDDTPLVPHDPSVIQLPYIGQQAPGVPAPWGMQSMPSSLDVVLPLPLPLPGVESETVPPQFYAQPQGHPMSALPPPPPPPPLHPAPNEGQLLASVPSNMAAPLASPASPISWFRVAYLGGISLRAGPSIDAPLTGAVLAQMETFPVSEEVTGSDCRIYLCLSDGRGWAFDDTALMPLDPSVKRGTWMPPQSSSHMGVTGVLQEVQADALPVRRRMHPQPRGKRGGKRCTRRNYSAAYGSASTGA